MELIEAIYDFDTPEPRWLEHLVDAAQRTFANAQGAAAYRYDLSRDANVSQVAGPQAIAALPLMVHEEMPLEAVRMAYGAGPRALPVSWAWATPQGPRLPPRFGRAIHDLDLQDGYAVLAPLGLAGIAIGIGMPRHRLRGAGSASVQLLNQRWTAIARHLTTALTLRHAFASEAPVEELRPGGPHLLQQHAHRVERTRDEATPEAVETWAGLLSGRWSLVRAQHLGTRTRYLAVENPPGGLRSLTSAELEVVERVRRGQTSKEIALDLHLEESTVATSIARALGKLGLQTREELVHLSAALLGPARN